MIVLDGRRESRYIHRCSHTIILSRRWEASGEATIAYHQWDLSGQSIRPGGVLRIL